MVSHTNFAFSPSRCISPKRLSFAFGLQYMSTKIFAHIPGPILFGHVVDLNCAIWQKVCEKTGYCWIYNLEEKRQMITTIAGILSGEWIFGSLSPGLHETGESLSQYEVMPVQIYTGKELNRHEIHRNMHKIVPVKNYTGRKSVHVALTRRRALCKSQI